MNVKTQSSKPNIGKHPKDPIGLFEEWMTEARDGEAINPNAMALATADAEGVPSVRMVLLKGADQRGFIFYTNSESQKGRQLEQNPSAALCFYWKSTRKQVRVEGSISIVDDDEADAYFESRPKDSQIGAWASRQSEALKSRFELEREVARYAGKFALTKVARPPFWKGYRLEPKVIEFWRERPFRLHDRLVYHRAHDTDAGWRTEKLFP
jgi:pyridoxamine 5'-phosphate oxidase